MSRTASRSGPRSRSRPDERPSAWPILILLLGALYCLLPLVWLVIASTKSTGQLFAQDSFTLGTHFFENIVSLSTYSDGIFWRWTLNTLLYAVVGAFGATFLAGLSGYVLAKFNFPGKQVVFGFILAGVLVPGVILAVPQFLMLSSIGMANTYWSVLLPQLITPYGIYLARIYAAASIPTEMIEAARTDGTGEFRIFRSIALPMMVPGMITIFLFQFVAIWNNFMLPYIMLGNDDLYPLTVGMQSLVSVGTGTAPRFTLVAMGSLLSILPIVTLFLVLQRYWRNDLAAGAVKV